MSTIAEALALAVESHRAGEWARAAQLYRQILAADPNQPEALQLLEMINATVASTSFERGNAALAEGKLDEAAAWYQQTLAAKPDASEAYCNLGLILHQRGKLDDAAACYIQALRLNPKHVETHNNLGEALRISGRLDEAILCFQRALEIRPDYVEALNNLGVTWQEQGKLDEALSCFDRTIALRPGYFEAHCNRGTVLQDQGQTDEAIASFDAALRINARPDIRYRRATCLPVCYRSMEHLLEVRQKLVHELESLLQEGVRFDALSGLLNPVFHLAYQGLNDRKIQETVAQLCIADVAAFAPSPRQVARASSKIRIGFVSRHFRLHTVGNLWAGLIAHLNRERFAVSVFSLGHGDDPMADFLRKSADSYCQLPLSVVTAGKAIAEADLDVLYYPDIGMEPMTYALAQFRLAPVQCVSWGHPVTTGLTSVDYFLSSELLEGGDADEHYTEKLVRFKTLGMYVSRPELPATSKRRSDFGLPEDKHLYGCLQSLFKLHPDYDAILSEILRRDPQGLLLLASGKSPHWDQLFMERFRRTMPDVNIAERIRWLPWQDYHDFLQITALVDVLLLPPHFGGGMTSYDALALGTPVVTLPSPFLRGRITHGMYRAMDVLDCVAESPADYVEIAVRLANDRDFRESVREKILAASGRLFEDLEAVREVERFLESVVERQGTASHGGGRGS
jgi:protein O-GlcNAc transferase